MSSVDMARGVSVALNPSAKAGAENAGTVRSLCGDVAALVRAVGTRAPTGELPCVFGFGAGVWDTLFGAPRPANLHPFREFGDGNRRAVGTPGDLLLHIRAVTGGLFFVPSAESLEARGAHGAHALTRGQ